MHNTAPPSLEDDLFDRDIWEAVVEAGKSLEQFFPRMDAPTVASLELPSVAARLNRAFIPPLPWRLLCLLAGLPGKALVIYLALWRLSRMYKTRTLDVTSTSLRGLGVSRMQKARGLQVLATAGLLTVDRRPKKNPQVTIRPVSELLPHPESGV
jgi:hypothetical protein